MSKKIALGVTGSIAAHKAIDIASELTKKGHQITVIMTQDAQKFITPLPFKTLSRRPVITDEQIARELGQMDALHATVRPAGDSVDALRRVGRSAA